MAITHGSRPTVEFDHTSPEYARRRRDHRDLRARCPVAFTEAHGGHWIVTGYESSRDRSATRPRSRHATNRPKATGSVSAESTSPRRRTRRAARDGSAGMELLSEDPQPALRAGGGRAIEAEAARVHQTACLDRHIESGTIDFVLDLANPVPAQATLAFLGLPLDDWEKYAGTGSRGRVHAARNAGVHEGR